MKSRPLRILVALCLLLLAIVQQPRHEPTASPLPPSSRSYSTEWRIPVGEAAKDAVMRERWQNTVKWNDTIAWNKAAQQGTARAAMQEGTIGAQAEQDAQDGTVWDRIAACESGGNWATNTGNSYYGGLQMNMQFWHSYGGDEYAERPDLASREQQIVVAERARDSGRGYRPWPVCGKRA